MTNYGPCCAEGDAGQYHKRKGVGAQLRCQQEKNDQHRHTHHASQRGKIAGLVEASSGEPYLQSWEA